MSGVVGRAAAHAYDELLPLLAEVRGPRPVTEGPTAAPRTRADLLVQLEAWLLDWVHGTAGPDTPDLTSLSRAVSFCTAEPVRASAASA